MTLVNIVNKTIITSYNRCNSNIFGTIMLFYKIADMFMLPASPSDDPLSGDAGDITNMDICG